MAADKPVSQEPLENALAVVALYQRVAQLEDEVARLREYEVKYRQMVDDTIKHSSIMSAEMMKLALRVEGGTTWKT